MERVVSATEARGRFGELMRRVAEDHERVIVERGGKAQIVLLSIAEYERLLGSQPNKKNWKELMDHAREQIQAELGGGEVTPPEEIIRQMREERDAQLLDLR